MGGARKNSSSELKAEKKSTQNKHKNSPKTTITSYSKAFGKDMDDIYHLLKGCSEDDPPICFIWCEIGLFVNYIQNFIDVVSPNGHQCPITPFLPANRPISVSDFKRGVLDWVIDQVPGVSRRFDGVLVCTAPQAIQCSAVLAHLCSNGWFIEMCAGSNQDLPLAHVVTTIPRSNNMCPIMPQLPCNLWH